MPVLDPVIRDVQKANAQASASLSDSLQLPAFATDPVNGDTIIVFTAAFPFQNAVAERPPTYHHPPTHSAPTDTAGNTYTQIGSTVATPATTALRTISMWMAKNIVGGSSFQVTVTADVYKSNATAQGIIAGVAWLVRNLQDYNADVVTNALEPNGSTANLDAGPTATPALQSFFLGGLVTANNSSTDGSGWNTTGVYGFTAGMKTNARNTANLGLFTEYLVSAAAQTFHWTDNAWPSYVAIGASFSPVQQEVTFTQPADAPIGLAWVELTDSSNAKRVWSPYPLPDDASYYGGYKQPRVLEWGVIRRALSDDQGQYEGTDFSWVLDDSDRVIRGLLASSATKYFPNRTVVARMITDDKRRLKEIARTIVRGRVSDYKIESGLKFRFTVRDQLAAKFSAANDTDQIPQRTITTADFPNAGSTWYDSDGKETPIAAVGLPVPIIYGEITDTQIVGGMEQGDGQCPVIYVGDRTIGGTAYRTLLVAGHACKSISAVYINNDGIDLAAYTGVGGDLLIPGYAGWTAAIGALPYEDINGNRYTTIYAKGIPGDRAMGLALQFWVKLVRTGNVFDAYQSSDGVQWNLIGSQPITMAGTVLVGLAVTSGTITTLATVRFDNVSGTATPLGTDADIGTVGIAGSMTFDSTKGEVMLKGAGAGITGTSDAFHFGSNSLAGDGSIIARVRSVASAANAGIMIRESTAADSAYAFVGRSGGNFVSMGRASTAAQSTVVQGGVPTSLSPDSGSVPFAISVAGIESVGDGSGTLLTDLLLQYRHCVQNWIIGNYKTGAWLASPAYSDDATLAMIDDTSFNTASALAKTRVSGGYRGDFILGWSSPFSRSDKGGKRVTVRDLIAQFNLCADVNSGFNRKTQFFVSMLDDSPASISAATLLTDVGDIHKETFSISDDLRHQYNVVPFRHTQDYFGRELEGWRSVESGVTEQKDDTSIANYAAPGESLRLVAPTMVLSMIRGNNRSTDYTGYTQGTLTADDVVRRFLLRHKDPPRLVSFQIGMTGWNIDLGDLLRVTHFEGISTTGWTARGLRVVRHEADPDTFKVDLQCLDLQQFYDTSFLLGDETSLPTWASATTAQRVYGFLCEETTVLFSDGAAGKRLR